MNWEFFSSRRRTTLEQFIKGAENLAEAKEIFFKRGIDLPLDGSLEKFYANSPKAVEKKETSSLDISASSTPMKPSPGPALPKTSVDYLEQSYKLSSHTTKNDKDGEEKQ